MSVSLIYRERDGHSIHIIYIYILILILCNNIILYIYEPPVGSIFLQARNVRNGLLAQTD